MKYRVEVAYKTKRGGVLIGMTIDADSHMQAHEKAERKVIRPYPARVFIRSQAKLIEDPTSNNHTQQNAGP